MANISGIYSLTDATDPSKHCLRRRAYCFTLSSGRAPQLQEPQTQAPELRTGSTAGIPEAWEPELGAPPPRLGRARPRREGACGRAGVSVAGGHFCAGSGARWHRSRAGRTRSRVGTRRPDPPRRLAPPGSSRQWPNQPDSPNLRRLPGFSRWLRTPRCRHSRGGPRAPSRPEPFRLAPLGGTEADGDLEELAGLRSVFVACEPLREAGAREFQRAVGGAARAAGRRRDRLRRLEADRDCASPSRSLRSASAGPAAGDGALAGAARTKRGPTPGTARRTRATRTRRRLWPPPGTQRALARLGRTSRHDCGTRPNSSPGKMQS
ncbi:uncharacterized protein [Tursiops truncatus]|uniref:uncharacterized protein n=1 Tax=Tursiops truncatus TaxID=9739 RepID=UPI003CCFBD28